MGAYAGTPRCVVRPSSGIQDALLALLVCRCLVVFSFPTTMYSVIHWSDSSALARSSRNVASTAAPFRYTYCGGRTLVLLSVEDATNRTIAAASRSGVQVAGGWMNDVYTL